MYAAATARPLAKGQVNCMDIPRMIFHLPARHDISQIIAVIRPRAFPPMTRNSFDLCYRGGGVKLILARTCCQLDGPDEGDGEVRHGRHAHRPPGEDEGWEDWHDGGEETTEESQQGEEDDGSENTPSSNTRYFILFIYLYLFLPQISETMPARKVPTANPEKKIIFARTGREESWQTRSHSLVTVLSQNDVSYLHLLHVRLQLFCTEIIQDKFLLTVKMVDS